MQIFYHPYKRKVNFFVDMVLLKVVHSCYRSVAVLYQKIKLAAQMVLNTNKKHFVLKPMVKEERLHLSFE